MTYKSAMLMLLAGLSLPMAAVAQSTIGELQRRNLVKVSGEVVQVLGDEFILQDGTGELLVEAETMPIRQANLKAGDRVTLSGQYDDDSFEAVSITTASGNTIYVFDD